MDKRDKRKIVFEKEDSFKTLEIINGWIGSIDTKASFLLAYVAVVMGFVVSKGVPNVFREPVPSPMTACYVLGLVLVSLLYIALVITVILLMGVITARIKHETNGMSMLFFGDIAKLSLNDYKEKILNRTEEELIKDILEQVHTNSKICLKKAEYYKWSIRFSFISTALYMICMVMGIF